MGLKLLRVGKFSVGDLRYRDWAIELCLVAWFSALLLCKKYGWDHSLWYWDIFDFVITGTIFVRLNRMLPRRCWRTVTYYSTYCLVAVVIGLAIVYFRNDGYFESTRKAVNLAVIASVFLIVALFGAFMWQRRVKIGKAILQGRTLRVSRKKSEY